MLNNDVTNLQRENKCLVSEARVSCGSNSNTPLSEKEVLALEKTKTKGISHSLIGHLNAILACASRTGDFSCFFEEVLLLLQCKGKSKIKTDSSFVIFLDEGGTYSILRSVESIGLNSSLKEGSRGRVTVCDLGSLALVFPCGSVQKQLLLQLVFNSVLKRPDTYVRTFSTEYVGYKNVDYTALGPRVNALQYALKNEDVKSLKCICNILKAKECHSILKQVATDALRKVIQEKSEISDNFLECVDCLLGAVVYNLELSARKNFQMLAQLNSFTEVICSNEELLKSVCNLSCENIVRTACLVDFENKRIVQSNHLRSDLSKVGHSACIGKIMNMNYGPDKDSGLSILVRNDNVRLLSYVLRKYSVDINKQNGYGYSVLHFAAIYNAEKCIRFLLDTYPQIMPLPAKSGLTPLHLAAGSDAFRSLKLLVQRFPSYVFIRDNFGRSIAHHAALGGHVANMQCCADLGMNLNDQAVVRNHNGEIDELRSSARACTPLHFAIEECHLDLVQYLVYNCNVDYFIKNNEGYTPITSVDCKGNTLVHQCVMQGRFNLLLNILFLGWEKVVPARNHAGYTAFDLAIENGRLDCAFLLLDYCMSDRSSTKIYGIKIFECKDSCGNTLLHQAVRACNVEYVKKILSYKDVSLMSLNKCQESPLDIAIKMRNAEIISLLLADKRQRLVAKDGISYVAKLISSELITAGIYRIISDRQLKREKYSVKKLLILSALSSVITVGALILAKLMAGSASINALINAELLSTITSCVLMVYMILLSMVLNIHLYNKLAERTDLFNIAANTNNSECTKHAHSPSSANSANEGLTPSRSSGSKPASIKSGDSTQCAHSIDPGITHNADTQCTQELDTVLLEEYKGVGPAHCSTVLP